MTLILLADRGDVQVKNMQWEKVKDTYTNSNFKIPTQKWQQVEHEKQLKALFLEVCHDLKFTIRQHIFTNDFQYLQLQNLKNTLPLDHAIAVGDFSQNYATISNDEIEADHYTTPQVIIHTWYLMRHVANST